ncbi:MAG: hypothetical protein ACJAWL_000176 [Motiliproteus sp.]|jgi:hypothetical protein
MKIIRMLLPNQQAVDYSLDTMLHLHAVQGATYSVVDLESGIIVEQAVLTRQADTLMIEIEGEQVATVEQFYTEGMVASVDMGSQAQQVAANDAVAESVGLVWELAADAGAVADGGFFSAPLLLFGGIAAGGLYSVNKDDAAAITDVTDLTIVVFDLVEGVSSSHSDRTFDPNVEYTIYIRVLSDSADLSIDGANAGNAALDESDGWDTWLGAANLGSDDTIILVGDGGGNLSGGSGSGVVISFQVSQGSQDIAWRTNLMGQYAEVGSWTEGGWFIRRGTSSGVDSAQLFVGGDWGSAPGQQATTPAEATGFNALNTMPAGILTSQGLA